MPFIVITLEMIQLRAIAPILKCKRWSDLYLYLSLAVNLHIKRSQSGRKYFLVRVMYNGDRYLFAYFGLFLGLITFLVGTFDLGIIFDSAYSYW